MKTRELRDSRWLLLRMAHWDSKSPAHMRVKAEAHPEQLPELRGGVFTRTGNYRLLTEQGKEKGSKAITKNLGANATKVENPTKTAIPTLSKLRFSVSKAVQ